MWLSCLGRKILSSNYLHTDKRKQHTHCPQYQWTYDSCWRRGSLRTCADREWASPLLLLWAWERLEYLWPRDPEDCIKEPQALHRAMRETINSSLIFVKTCSQQLENNIVSATAAMGWGGGDRKKQHIKIKDRKTGCVLKRVEDWLSFLSFLDFLSYHHHKAESPWTYQWSPDLKTSERTSWALADALGPFFQAETQREATVISLHAHTPGACNGSTAVGSQNASTVLQEPMPRDTQGGRGHQHWSLKPNNKEDPAQRFHKGETRLILPTFTRVYKTEAENRRRRKGRKRKTKNYNGARLVVLMVKRKGVGVVGKSKSLDLIPLCFSE